QMIEPDMRNRLRREGQQRERGEVIDVETPHELGHLLPVLLIEAHGASMTAVFILQTAREPGGDLLEGPVLQEPREQQIACFEERDSLRIHELALREKTRDLHVEKRRRDDEELG